MKRVNVLAVAALAVAGLGCQPQQAGSSTSDLAAVQCDAGSVAFNFTRFPTTHTSEGLHSAADAGLAANLLPKPNLITITKATCNGAADWKELVKDGCEGQQTCTFQRTDCRGADVNTLQGPVRVSYACSADPGTETNLICNPPLKNCLFQLACAQPKAPTGLFANAIPQPQQQIACVPEKCNVTTRRGDDMQCVVDEARPTEYSFGTSNQRSNNMVFYMDTRDVRLKYPSMRNLRGSKQLDMEFEHVDYFNYDAFFSYGYDTRLKDSDLANNRVLLSNALYEVKASVFYPVKPGTANEGMKGTLALWIYDEYKRSATSTPENAFRCLLHSVDMSKYGKGTQVKDVDGSMLDVYRIDIDEELVVPADCRLNSPMFFQSQGILSGRHGLSSVDFGNQYTRTRAQLAASYDLEGTTMLLDDFDPEAVKTACAPNPLDLYYDEAAQRHDRYAYYAQRQIITNVTAHPLGPWQKVQELDTKLGSRVIYVEEANLTTLGLSAVRPKALEYKVRTVGPARGFLRVDADWYLSGDRHHFFNNFGLKDQAAYLESFLVPLDANGNARPESDQLSLGVARIYESETNGTTISAKYAITEALRNEFIKQGGTYEATKAGTKFKFRTCVRLGDGSQTLWEPPQYTLWVPDDNKCRTTESSFLLKVDHTVAPLLPVSADDLSESNPAATGDDRMQQGQDNDQDRQCAVMDGGVEVCRTSGAAGVEGQGSFGGSVLAVDNSGYNEGTTKAHLDKQVELSGFEVLDEEEDKPYSGPDAKLSFNVSPDWDRIAELLHTTIPGPRIEGDHFSGGIKGLSIGLEWKVPVHYGPLEGEIIYGVSTGVGLEVVFEYAWKLNQPAGCANDECQLIYKLQPSATLPLATTLCYAAGGRLADLSTKTEADYVQPFLASNGKLWLGGQVADEYAKPFCLQAWLGPLCATGHTSYLRWLSNDEDFASVTSFGQFTLDTAQVASPTAGGTLTAPSIAAARPIGRGVTLDRGNQLGVAPLTDTYPSICKVRNSASVSTHELKASLELVLAGGFSLAFCSPSDEAGVCLEGSFNIVESKLIPSVTYTHNNFKDTAGRRGTQSDIKLSLDYEVHLLSGDIQVKVQFGPWFSFHYTLFEFAGLELPLGGNLTEKEYPLKEDFK